ncbi:unnamed protein product, partial [Rotaria sordida]
MRAEMAGALYERAGYLVERVGAGFGLQPNGQAVLALADYGKRFGFFLGDTVRAELIDILKEPIEKTGNLHYNHNVINITQDPDGLLKKIFPQTSPPIYTTENIFYGVIDHIDQQTSINSSIRAKNTLTQYIDRGEFITCRIGQKEETMWAGTYPSDAPPPTRGDSEWTEINNRRELYNVLKRFPRAHPIHECAAATDQ